MTMTSLAPAIDRAETAGRLPCPTITPDVLRRIRAEFREMPGLRLTLQQGMRLFQLDALTCDIALRTLIEEGYLRRSGSSAFRRAAD